MLVHFFYTLKAYVITLRLFNISNWIFFLYLSIFFLLILNLI